jgi:hypothetical protein
MYYLACMCVPTYLGIKFQCATSRRVIPERQWSPVQSPSTHNVWSFSPELVLTLPAYEMSHWHLLHYAPKVEGVGIVSNEVVDSIKWWSTLLQPASRNSGTTSVMPDEPEISTPTKDCGRDEEAGRQFVGSTKTSTKS